MERLSEIAIIKKLNSEELSLFDISDFKKLFFIEKDNTAYKIIERLTKKGIFQRLTKKRYRFSLLPADDFNVANFLCSPSYVSLESALSFYGIIAQFPYKITSVTLKKTKTFIALEKDFSYSHIQNELFFGYEEKDDFLIALPEKALFDFLYFSAKGLKNFEKDEFDFRRINKKLLSGFIKKARNAQLNGFLAKIKL